MIDLGQTLQRRRQEMELSLSELTRLMGGAPGESYLSRVERGQVPLSPEVAHKIARVLRLPEGAVLNASGRTTDEQIEAALQQLMKVAVSPVAKTYPLSVLDRKGEVVETRRRMLTTDEPAFLFDTQDDLRTPDVLVGEALVLEQRKPVDGIGIVAEVDGELSAWTYYKQGGKVWIENGRKERRSRGFEIKGIIARVAHTQHFIE